MQIKLVFIQYYNLLFMNFKNPIKSIYWIYAKWNFGERFGVENLNHEEFLYERKKTN